MFISPRAIGWAEGKVLMAAITSPLIAQDKSMETRVPAIFLLKNNKEVQDLLVIKASISTFGIYI